MSDELTQWATWGELHAQPNIWRGWAGRMDMAALRAWIAAQTYDEVWFCGAGTSAYIGDILVAGLEGQGAFRSVPTTDIVSRPQAFLTGKRPLVVNFGRSGNSSESIGCLDVLDALAPDAPRLNITCNAEGALATRTVKSQHTVVLPSSTHDAGFAMTSSFSTMLYTALGAFTTDTEWPAKLRQAASMLDALLPAFTDAPGPRPERAVFLGAGPLAFAAREAALKVMELTAGQTPALWDSTLGFRHGPKSFVTDETLICLFTSSDPHTARYDADLVAELRAQYPAARVLTIGPGGDIDVKHPNGDIWGAPVVIAFAQIAGVLWSHALGLNVDDPFAGEGTLSRVVSGVTLYEVRP